MIEFRLKEIKPNGDNERLMGLVMNLIREEVSSGVVNDDYTEIRWHTVSETNED